MLSAAIASFNVIYLQSGLCPMTVPDLFESCPKYGQCNPLRTRVPMGGSLESFSPYKSFSMESLE